MTLNLNVCHNQLPKYTFKRGLHRSTPAVTNPFFVTPYTILTGSNPMNPLKTPLPGARESIIIILTLKSKCYGK